MYQKIKSKFSEPRTDILVIYNSGSFMLEPTEILKISKKTNNNNLKFLNY